MNIMVGIGNKGCCLYFLMFSHFEVLKVSFSLILGLNFEQCGICFLLCPWIHHS